MFGIGRLMAVSVHRLMMLMVPRMTGMQWTRRVGSHATGVREELREVAAWAKRFKVEDLPRDKFTAAFSRSSGPGGQNVNKGKEGFIHALCVD